MKAKVENIGKNLVQLEIEVDAAKFEEGMQKSYSKNVKKFNVPGFRKGKAPRNIIESYYGEQALYEDAINFVFPEEYDQAVKENDLYPVDRPEIDIKEIGKGKNLVFTAKVTVKPEVELGEYKGIEVNKIEVSVSDEDVENELKRVADSNARLITIEDRPLQNGDTAVIDFEGFVDEVAFEGGKGENYSLVIGSGQFIPGFEEQLIGAEKGENRDVNVTFPEDYGSKDLAGKAAVFKVTVNEIKFKELPVVDDEFAKDVSEFDTLEEYKEDIRKKLLESAEHKAHHDTEDSAVDKAVENATVEIPEVMIEKQIDNMIYNFEMSLRYQGMDLQKYMEILGLEPATFREQFKSRAEKEVKSQLVLEKISKVEGFEATEDDVNGEIKKLAENYKQEEEEFKKHLRDDDIEYIKGNLVMKKTVDFIVENAKMI